MPEISSSKYLVQAGWDSVPHLDEKTKAELLASTPPHLRDARMKGEPGLGSGAIYPIPLSDILVDPFQIPAYWPRAYALDVGWNRTAALWGAFDRTVDCMYLYTEHYRGQAEPSIHAAAIKARGDWIPGVIDPAARGRKQDDGQQLIAQYRECGLNLIESGNALEAGIYAVWEMLSTGRLKVFRTMMNWQAEYRLYRRDEKGAVVKAFDHLMDCFTPDTLVWTEHGLVPIAEMPETGYVLTAGGGYAPYKHCGLVRKASRVVRLVFSDGSDVTCTPDHLFMTPGGWVAASDLPGHACYDAVSGSIHEAQSCTLPLSQPPSRSSAATDTTHAGSISAVQDGISTGMFGRPATDLFRMVRTSTTSTETGATTSQTTLPLLSPASICRGITKAIHAGCRKALLRLQGLGTALRLGALGIFSIISRIAQLPCMHESRWSVIIAGKSSWGPQPAGSAPMPASPHGDGRKERTLKTGHVPYVGGHSGSASIHQRKHAAGRALVHCLRAEDAGVSDVYCIEVPSTRAFAVGMSGLLAHNCTRYLVLSGRSRAICQPVERYAHGVGSAGRGDPVAGY